MLLILIRTETMATDISKWSISWHVGPIFQHISFQRRQRGTDTAALASNMSWELDILALNISITKR